MASKNRVTVCIDDKKLKRHVVKIVRPRFRPAGEMVANQIKAEIASMNATAGGGGLGPAGSLEKAIVVRKRGVGVRVGAKSGSEAAAVLKRLSSGFAGRDRLGRLYTQAPRPIIEPIMERSKARILNMIQGG